PSRGTLATSRSRADDIAQLPVGRGEMRPKDAKERARHHGVVAGVGRDDMEGKTREDVLIRAPPARLDRVPFDDDALLVLQDPLERAELHRRERIIDLRQSGRAEDLSPYAAQEAALTVAAQRAFERRPPQLPDPLVARRGVVMKAMQIRVKHHAGGIAQ